MNSRSLYISGLTTALFIVLCTLASYGQSDLSIVYSPMVTELAGERGSVVPFEIIIGNESIFSTAHFRVSVHGLAETPEGVYKTRDDEWTFDAKDWIELDEDAFSIAPGEFYTLRGVARIPRRAPGAGYATIITELLPEEAPADVDASTLYYQSFSTALEIVVGQRHKKSGFISEVKIVPTANDPTLSMLYGRDRLMFLATLENDGDIHVAGRGQLIVRDMNGRRIRSVPLGSGRGVVIPEAKLEFGSLIGMLPPGEYEMEARIDFGGHRPAVARTHFDIGDELSGFSALVGRGLRVDVTPSVVDLHFPRQGYRAQSVTVENYDREDILFQLHAEPLAHDDNGVPIAVDKSVQLPYSAASWVEMRPSEFVLKPGQRRNVVIGFRVLESLQGGRYARIKVVARPVRSDEPDDGDNRTDVVTDLDVDAHVTFGTEHVYDVSFGDLQWTQPSGQPKIRLGVRSENTGNIHLDVAGSMTLVRFFPGREEVVDDVIVQHDERWEVVEHVSVEAPGGPILPGESRMIQTEFDTLLDPHTQYRVVTEITEAEGAPTSRQLLFWVDDAGVVREGEITSPTDGAERRDDDSETE